MSEHFPLQLFSICPSALCDGDLVHYFGPRRGRLLARFPVSKIFSPTSWKGNHIGDEKVVRCKENLDALISLGSFTDYHALEASYQIQDRFLRVVDELRNKKCTLSGAIVDDLGDFEKTRGDRIYSGAEFKRLALSPHKKFFTDYNAESLLSAFLPVIDLADTFKIVDPYIFNIDSEKNAADRFRFLVLMIRRIAMDSAQNLEDKTIEIYGLRDKAGTPESLKGHIAQFSDLMECSGILDVHFFCLEKEPIIGSEKSSINRFSKKKIHDRYFYASDYLFEVEDTFQERVHENAQQWIRFVGDSEEKEYVQYAFSAQSPIFRIALRFSLDDLARLVPT